MRFGDSAAKRFTTDPDELKNGINDLASAAFIKNYLSDAQVSPAAAELEIGLLIQESRRS